jgi:hypothetical protein
LLDPTVHLRSRTEVLAALREGVEQLTDSRQWERWLRFRRRFHRYSFHNQVLILRQFPEASQVAGYRAWQLLGRQVRRGERGMAIIAPVALRRPDGGEAERLRDLDLPILTYRVARVFDVSQTEGRVLPVPVGEMPAEAPPQLLDCLLALAPSLGFTVEFTELRSGRRGDCSHALRRIRVDRRLSPGPKVKTLSHELAHAILHGPEFSGSRELAELEAESVAYVVCQKVGLDSSAYSFGYVASWAGSGPAAARQISRSGERILQAAAEISQDRDVDLRLVPPVPTAAV